MGGLRRASVGAVVMLAACGGGGSSSDEADDLDAHEVTSRITVTSPAFDADTPMPEKHTCAGDDVSPPLAWEGSPEQAVELALVVDDPDAPGGTYVHWIVAGIDPATTSMAEGEVPDGAVEARNSADRAGWSGPCPPEGPAHDYRFTVYALEEATGLEDGADSDDAFAAIRDHAFARGRLTTTFER